MDRVRCAPRHYAALSDDVAQVVELFAGGADPDAADIQGFTALHFACQQGDVESARVLLDGGATVDSVDAFGNTPLWTAVFNSRGRGDLIELLRTRGADPLHVNNTDRTPVSLARFIANFDVAQFFTDLPA